ncbi:MAG: cobalamin-dependent protein [Candidatus Heimdallarchaeota archaeon]
MASSKDVILNYLKLNRGREIPVSEIKVSCNLKLSTISNAIKELQYRNLINIERRPLKRGKYTVITLASDIIEHRYVHPKEYNPPPRDDTPKSETILQEDVNHSFQELLDTYIANLISDDYNMETFGQEIADRYPDHFQLVTAFITPLLVEVGRRWEEGTLTTAEEHVISSRLEKFIIQLIPQKLDKSKATVLLVTVEGEEHVIGLLALELLLRENGHRVVNLGRTLPIKSLIQYIEDQAIKPDWICFSVTIDAFIGTLLREIREIKAHFKDRIKIAVGGQALQKHRNTFVEVDTLITSDHHLFVFIHDILPDSVKPLIGQNT